MQIAQSSGKKQFSLLKIAIWAVVWLVAVAIGFLTRKNSSVSEPFIVGTGVTFIIYMGLLGIKIYDRIMDRADEALKKRR